MPNPPKLPVPRFDRNGLYLLLTETDQTQPNKHHWALLLATSVARGFRFHLAHSKPSTNSYLAVEPIDLSDAAGPMAALKLDIVESTGEEWICRMKECVRTVKAESNTSSCRSWTLAALYELASEGFISMIAEWDRVRHIELEANCLAREAVMVGGVVIENSRWGGPS